jgi:hypothetical protein
MKRLKMLKVLFKSTKKYKLSTNSQGLISRILSVALKHLKKTRMLYQLKIQEIIY